MWLTDFLALVAVAAALVLFAGVIALWKLAYVSTTVIELMVQTCN